MYNWLFEGFLPFPGARNYFKWVKSLNENHLQNQSRGSREPPLIYFGIGALLALAMGLRYLQKMMKKRCSPQLFLPRREMLCNRRERADTRVAYSVIIQAHLTDTHRRHTRLIYSSVHKDAE